MRICIGGPLNGRQIPDFKRPIDSLNYTLISKKSDKTEAKFFLHESIDEIEALNLLLTYYKRKNNLDKARLEAFGQGYEEGLKRAPMKELSTNEFYISPYQFTIKKEGIQ